MRQQRHANGSNVTTNHVTAAWAKRIKRTLAKRISRGKSEPLLTLFTTWNDNDEKYLVHNLTTRNWLSLRPFVIPVVFTNEPAIANDCREKGWLVHAIRMASSDGFPVMKYMYEDVIAAYSTTFYAYSNSDILYTNNLIETLIAIAYNNDAFTTCFSNLSRASLGGTRRDAPVILEIAGLSNKTIDTASPGVTRVGLAKSGLTNMSMLMVGKRTNVDHVTKKESSTWDHLTSTARRRGELFTPDAMDYFIVTKDFPWKLFPEVTIGRQNYDNFLVFLARKLNLTVIDATNTLLAIHQTTSAGNFESRYRKNQDFDLKMLLNIYDCITWRAGFSKCAEYKSKYEQGFIKFIQRNITMECSLTQSKTQNSKNCET